MENTFDKIIEEIRGLVNYESKNLPEKMLKFSEEYGEFSAEVIKFLCLTHKPYDREHLIEEAADTLQVLISIFVQLEKDAHIPIQEIFDKIPEKNQKWLSKIPQYTKALIKTPNNGFYWKMMFKNANGWKGAHWTVAVIAKNEEEARDKGIKIMRGVTTQVFNYNWISPFSPLFLDLEPGHVTYHEGDERL